MDAIRKVYQHAEPNLTIVGWMGLVGFPFYYWVWEFLFPQSYENLPLRLLCSMLFAGIIFRNRFPTWLRRYAHIYYLVTVTLCLPCFFFYMLLMNDWSNVWVMSFMSAIFLQILLTHVTRVMFAQTIIGLSLATLFAWLANGFKLDITIEWAHIPIFVFIYIFGNLFYFRNQIEHEAKVSLAKSFGAGIAHEMRNPLSALCTSIDVIQSVLPTTKNASKASVMMSVDDINLLREVSEDAMKLIHSGNETIDLLLTSIDENRVSRSTFKRHSAQFVVEDAITSFCANRHTDREVISLDVRRDFEFLGSATLLKYALYNLFKNAYQHCRADGLHIQVTLYSDDFVNQIVVTDNGSGICPDVIEKVFQDFYTTGKRGRHGLGLPFCKRVMRSFGGDIMCQSEHGAWSQFTLRFPPINSNTVTNIKAELTKLKTVLLVSKQGSLVDKMVEMSRAMGFSLTLIDARDVLKKQEHEFEFDLIYLDIDGLDDQGDELARIVVLFSFTEARIVYLYDSNTIQSNQRDGFQPIWIKTRHWLSDAEKVMDQLLFKPNYSLYSGKVLPSEMSDKRRIMVVDDNESVRKYTAILLEKLGFDVIQKANGRQALDWLKSESVDLILMDLEMPVMDGLEASKQIRYSEKPYSCVPIIAHTGDCSSPTLDKVNASGMSDFIVKPADKNRLYDKISNWL